MLDMGWFTVFARVLILAAIVWAGYIAYDLDRQGDTTKGIIWGGLLVETFGGASQDLTEKGFQQGDARMMADELKSCLQD